MAGTGPADDAGEPVAVQPGGSAGWWRRRWRGQAGRLEVWYATATDAATGTGLWVHGETVAPTDGGPARAVGWAAVFPADGPPVWARTPDGPAPAVGAGPPDAFTADGIRIGPDGSAGSAGDIRWRLAWDTTSQVGLATFPRWAWERELLPASQVVPAPELHVTGAVEVGGRAIGIDGHGQAARIYGHGNARRWAWLHADLGHGDLIEVVSAVSTRPGLRAAPPVTFLQLRLGGVDWPSLPVAAFGLRARLGLPEWTVRGRVRGATVDLRVSLPPERCVSIPYADPDGATATCTNTERADLWLRVRSRSGTVREWDVRGTAHAEVGTRP